MLDEPRFRQLEDMQFFKSAVGWPGGKYSEMLTPRM